MRYRPMGTHTLVTSATAESSSSSGVYASPRTRTLSPTLMLPEKMRVYASNAEQSDLGKSLPTNATTGPCSTH